jgi:hypothetical protein
MSSGFSRPKKFEADEPGGDIKNLLSYEYEKEFLVKA